MRGGESGTSVIQVPEFKIVNFRVVKKSTRVRSGITLHVIGNEAREQVAVKGEKEFLEVQHIKMGNIYEQVMFLLRGFKKKEKNPSTDATASPDGGEMKKGLGVQRGG